MEVTLIKGCSDLGTHIDGAKFGPSKIVENITFNGKIKEIIQADIIKSKDKLDLRKNEKEIFEVNFKIYQEVSNAILENTFPITLGGDHSIAIASSLASIKHYQNLGIIWFDSHADYNTFDTTITGNIHGLPLATINGLNKDLSSFHKGNFYNPKNTVIVGYRAKEENQNNELNNIKEMGVTVFTTEDIKKHGIKVITKKALEIASNKTNGIHISYDLDVIDPAIAPGVSVKEENGITEDEAYQFIEELKSYQKQITSFDLVEFNPTNDIDDKTLTIAKNILNKFIKIKTKKELDI